jgi:hypothetical protein
MRPTFPTRPLFTAAALVAVGAAAVGTVAIAKPDAAPSQADRALKPVLIETAITFSENAPAAGRIERLFIGERSPCRRARFTDEARHTTIIKRIDCGRSGNLTLRFGPRPNRPTRNKSGSWRLIEGTGSFRGLEGGGTMFARGERRAPRGREVFTGTLR